MKIDWKLKGWNLLKFGCNANSIIHPETCADVVKIEHDSEKSLYDWITSNGLVGITDSLSTWIANNLLASGASITVNDVWTSSFVGLTDSNSVNIGYIGTNSNNNVRIPKVNSGSALFGLSRAGTGLVASEGVYSVDLATTNNIGGIKIGYSTPSDHPTYKPVLLDNGKAYVNVGEQGHTINQWGPSGVESYDTYNIPICVAFRTSEVQTDPFINMNLLSGQTGRPAMDTYFNSIGTSWSSGLTYNRCFPVMRDTAGAWYVYVPYPNITEMGASGTSHKGGLVPDTGATAGTTKFLREDKTWSEIPQFSSSVNGLVPAASGTGADGKFLKGNGTWDIPTDTTYSTSTHDNADGLLQIKSDDVEANVAEPAEETTIIAPVVYSYKESNEGHGVSIDTIVKAIEDSDGTFLIPLMQAIIGSLNDDTTTLRSLVTAISSDSTSLTTLVGAIASDTDALSAFFTKDTLDAFNTALAEESEAIDALKQTLGIS